MIKLFGIITAMVLLLACSKTEAPSPDPMEEVPSFDFQYLALGDSYTIGQGVCSSCNFPQQLIDSIAQQSEQQGILQNVARTGWTTSRLLAELEQRSLDPEYDLVTLLIGVNNQYLEFPFETYEQELPQLVTKAIGLAQGEASRVLLLSIPDYRFTPFGQTLANPEQVSTEIDEYNSYAQLVASQQGVSFFNITQLSREGLTQPELVSSDGLHLSAVAYQKVVERIYGKALRVVSTP